MILPVQDKRLRQPALVFVFFNQSDNSQVKLYNDSAYTAIDAEGKAEMKFIARYVATNATVTAGTANADSQFTVEYKK